MIEKRKVFYIDVGEISLKEAKRFLKETFNKDTKLFDKWYDFLGYM